MKFLSALRERLFFRGRGSHGKKGADASHQQTVSRTFTGNEATEIVQTLSAASPLIAATLAHHLNENDCSTSHHTSHDHGSFDSGSCDSGGDSGSND
ncbi:hypothetical protein [Phytobacter massiliensis]|uniref:hypothetical protein n=1 Tax=Phytobacter massiliensis TaxID=1485952 RepID=UPI0003085310|nr:hypothetical protein [Phytobacter massiliensis]